MIQTQRVPDLQEFIRSIISPDCYTKAVRRGGLCLAQCRIQPLYYYFVCYINLPTIFESYKYVKIC